MSDFVLSPSADPDWLLVEDGIDPAREREIEAILAVGNGYLSARASFPEGSRFMRPATFVAGLFVSDRDFGPRLAVLPPWLHVEVMVEERRLSCEAGRMLSYRRMLDLRQGILWREWRQQDPSGRITRVTDLQIASLADRHLLLQSVTVTAENYAGRIGLVTRLGFPEGARTDVDDMLYHSDGVRMRVSGTELGVAAVSQLQGVAGQEAVHSPTDQDEHRSMQLGLGETASLERMIAVFTSRDAARPVTTAHDKLVATSATGFAAAASAHLKAWRERREAAEIRILGDQEIQRALCFAVYHLIAAANPGDEHVSIGARGLTGEAYRGHVFWDTEIYMLPFYVFTDPPAARALLMYRYHSLDAARRKAKAHGYEGAFYAWESADTGDEVTPSTVVAPDGHLVIIRTGKHELHISADIAYGVWQYWRATGDDAFMATAGVEILVETARFWVSRAEVETEGRAHIRQVIGPDEYHELVDDNAYTNAMAAFNLDRAADAVAFLKGNRLDTWQRLAARLGLTEDEPQTWRKLASVLVTGFDPATKLFEQFAGYFKLEDIDQTTLMDCSAPVDVCLGAERVARSKVCKQADVVALSAELWDPWPAAVHEANFRYYGPRTVHGSSLSPALHALVAARLGDLALAQAYFQQAAEIDLSNNVGNAAGGVHMGALGGLWRAAVFGAAGLRLGDDGIAVDPHLLPGWVEMSFPLQCRGRLLRLCLRTAPRQIEVTVERGDEMSIAVLDGPACRARAGQRYILQGDAAGWTEWKEVER
ncbi:MAG TPA: glycosyl hydrolase family 65 protein [Xanthobacteraceae bacterium]|nr:glycosyl hydrolase family 65 protein [Xanthobacteraceae bacterium]